MKSFRVALMLLFTMTVLVPAAMAEPGKGKHHGTGDNPGKHKGWGEDSAEVIDSDSTPSGAPLPGALTALVIGGVAAAGISRIKKSRRLQ